MLVGVPGLKVRRCSSTLAAERRRPGRVARPQDPLRLCAALLGVGLAAAAWRGVGGAAGGLRLEGLGVGKLGSTGQSGGWKYF
jgi:hypothetical protein